MYGLAILFHSVGKRCTGHGYPMADENLSFLPYIGLHVGSTYKQDKAAFSTIIALTNPDRTPNHVVHLSIPEQHGMLAQQIL